MFKVLTDGCEPKRATKFSAAIDLFAAEDMVIGAGETAKIPLGVCIDEQKIHDTIVKYFRDAGYHNIDVLEHFKTNEMARFKRNHYLQVSPRSSLGLKGLIIPNGIGIIDLDYKDQIHLILHNPYTNKKDSVNILNGNGDAIGVQYIPRKGFKISKGEKIAQIMLCEHKSYLMGYESEEERVGGFGSTGE